MLWLARKHGAMVEGVWEDPRRGGHRAVSRVLELPSLDAWTEMVKQRLLAFPWGGHTQGSWLSTACCSGMDTTLWLLSWSTE